MPTAISVSQVQVSNNSKAQAVAKAQALALQKYETQSTFDADAVLFDMVSLHVLSVSIWGMQLIWYRTAH